MGWHPSWYACNGCGCVFLERHPRKCYCGADDWLEVGTEDMFTEVSRDREHSKHCECFTVYKSCPFCGDDIEQQQLAGHLTVCAYETGVKAGNAQRSVQKP